MKTHIYEKLNGWPAITLGILVLLATAFSAFYTYGTMEKERSEILAELEYARAGNYELMRALGEREGVIDAFQGQIKDISSTVGTLEKLAKTDEELLKKYSKVYFLNENYSPAKLVEIDKVYLTKEATNKQIHAQVWPKLESMIIDGNRAGADLVVASAFRSFATQSTLKTGYTSVYGTGANKFSADQGYSEHQLGTALDFSTSKLGANFNSFAETPGYQWLRDNAHKYGFILSYPPKNVYYKFEPWHWRYVGVELATDLHKEGKFFYDLEQREIDEYLIKLFD